MSAASDQLRNIALVAHGGAGKTSLINLIIRFYDPDTGCIMLNDLNIKK
ncbi:MAG: ATP-binding cassette domain-containing protein, partial [candidate division Zixibacteria bacterium]|nr:ATP-binding cassette domain-containing protein [candidate division Zixibacteria bacterium]